MLRGYSGPAVGDNCRVKFEIANRIMARVVESIAFESQWRLDTATIIQRIAGAAFKCVVFIHPNLYWRSCGLRTRCGDYPSTHKMCNLGVFGRGINNYSIYGCRKIKGL